MGKIWSAARRHQSKPRELTCSVFEVTASLMHARQHFADLLAMAWLWLKAMPSFQFGHNRSGFPVQFEYYPAALIRPWLRYGNSLSGQVQHQLQIERQFFFAQPLERG